MDDVARRALPRLGAVVAQDGSPWWVVTFPGAGVVHEPTRAWLRDLAACDCSPSTLRSYAYGLLRWLRFLWLLGVRWEQAERVHVGAFVAYLQQAANPLRARRSPTAPPLGSVNPITGKAYPGNGYARRTINHQLSALFSFYAFAVDADLGPLVNPVPAQRGYRGGRPHAHHSPMEEFALARPATYRQHVPRQVPRSIPDAAVDALFGALRTNRDRALVAFYLSSGARASELLGLQHDRIDVGRRTIKVVSKGSRALDEVPASRDAFVWLALYLAEGFVGHGATPVWWTLRAPRRPLSYHGMRAVLGRANAALGTNYSLHDLRHTAAARLAADPSFTLVEVQAILRHAHLSTTQLYLQPRLEELIERLTQHYAQQRRQAPLQVPVGYDQAVVAELLGLPQ